MTSEFQEGVDWFVKMCRVFTLGEMKLIWALKRAAGEFVTHDALHLAMTDRRISGSNNVNVHMSRIRVRCRGMGMRIICERRHGWRMVENEDAA